MDMNTPYRLHYAPDNASLIIRLALDEMGLDYDTVLVDRRQRAQLSKAYLTLNPHGKIPVLETPDGAIFETGAILLWLSDRHQKMAPAAKNAARGEFLKWLFFTSNTLHSQLTVMFYTDRFVGNDHSAQTRLRNHLAEQFKQHLLALDEFAASKPSWFNTATPGVLDLYVVACLRWLALYPKEMPRWFDLRMFPNLYALARRLEQRPSVARLIAAEALGDTPFTSPSYPNPPQGSAL